MMLPWSWILTLDESEWIQVNKKIYTSFLGISKGIFKVHIYVEIPKNANLFWQNYIDNTSKAHIGTGIPHLVRFRLVRFVNSTK